jgi:hypothetical protein
MNITEPTMIGLSERAHGLLSQMKEDNFLAEMADGYRLGIGLALSQGIDPPDVPSRRTVFSVATIDPDQEIAAAIRSLMDLQGGSVYKMAERLADWGVIELAKRFDDEPLDVSALLQGTISSKL